MKKINIVKYNREFNNIINNGKYMKNSFFIIYYLNNELNRCRFGISVGKKVCNAVNRNRLKRQIRNILDNNQNIYSNNKDYIIILRKSCVDITYDQLEDNLILLIKKIEKEYANEKK